ncbi:MAG: hypothetical protein KJT03_15155, partial [Verrucomicrobiae bacterium]|nr:hypothetical protein [Verrucomicrobiae bacterium]
MKTFTLFSVMCFFSMTSSHGEGEVKLSGAYGGGLHRYYDLTQWDGKEQVVSRLKKGDHVILFVRVSKEDFEVKDGEDGTQIFFRFNSRLDSMSPGLQSAFLVDFIRKNDEAAILMLGSRGYFYMRSSAVAPKVIPPKHFFPNKKLIPTEWFPRFIMPARDYYPEVPGIVSEKVIEAKLKS